VAFQVHVKWVVSTTSSSKVSAVKKWDCNQILHPGSRLIVVPGPTVTGKRLRSGAGKRKGSVN